MDQKYLKWPIAYLLAKTNVVRLQTTRYTAMQIVQSVKDE